MIPRITHQIWIGKKKFPKMAKEYRDKLIELNPGWDHIFWDDEMVLKNKMDENPVYNLSSNCGHKSDVLRYELMYKIGGIYIDVDVEILKNLVPLLETKAFFGSNPPFIENAVIGSEEGSLFFGYVLSQLPAWYKMRLGGVVERTGPGFLKAMVERFPAVFGASPFTILPKDYFYPNLNKKDFSGSYGIHKWWGKWK